MKLYFFYFSNTGSDIKKLCVGRVVGTTSLDDGGKDLLLVDVINSGEVELAGVDLDDSLDISLVDRDLGALEGRDSLADPGDEDELGALALLVTGGETDVAVLALVLLEVGLDLLEAVALTLGVNNEDVALGVFVLKDEPGGLGLAGENLVVKLLNFGVSDVCHFYGLGVYVLVK